MTREERLSLAIATFHEAKPIEPPSVIPAHPLMGSPCSPGGWWVWAATDVKLIGSTGAGHFEAVSEWIPADCTTAHNAMRLLKELLAKRSIAFNCIGYSPMEIEVFGVGRFAIDVSLELAIAEAFAKAFNLEVSE